MNIDDIKKLATGSVLFSLDKIIAPKLLPLMYLLGLGTIMIWGINHLFSSFALGFGAGLWGLLEIVVLGLLSFVILRVLIEAALIHFKDHINDATSNPAPASQNLLDDVRHAIEDLADAAEKSQSVSSIEEKAPSTSSKSAPASRPVKKTVSRRTAKRNTPKSTNTKSTSPKSTSNKPTTN